MVEDQTLTSPSNQSRQPTPGARLPAYWTTPARRGCALRSSGARCCDPEFYFSLKNPDSGPIMRPTPVGPQLNGVGADGPAGVGILGDYTCCSGWVFESHKFR